MQRPIQIWKKSGVDFLKPTKYRCTPVSLCAAFTARVVMGSSKRSGSMARRLIIFAPSLLHDTTPYLLTVKMRLKDTERKPLWFWWRFRWALDVDFVESGWTFFFLLLPQPVTRHSVQHHLPRRIFCCVPLHRPVETWAISPHIEHAATKGL